MVSPGAGLRHLDVSEVSMDTDMMFDSVFPGNLDHMPQATYSSSDSPQMRQPQDPIVRTYGSSEDL